MPDSQQQINMTADEAKASLGMATHLQSQLLPQAPQAQETAPQKPQTEQPQESSQEPKKDDMGAKMTELELTMTTKLDQIRQEMKDSQKMEMEALKNDIKEALNDGQEN